MDFTFDGTVISVNLHDRSELLSVVAARFASHQGFALATINLDHLVKLGQSQQFRKAYAAQDLVVADGNPIVWLSYLAGRPVSLVPGSDMVIPMAQLAAKAAVRVGLVGSTDSALAAAARRLCREVPDLIIAARISPPFGFDPDGEGAARIMADLSKADVRLCFIALGAPKQEAFAAFGRRLAPEIGFASVGAGLDFLAGQQTRAPEWMRDLALEWLWRLTSSPKRFVVRYAACAAILPKQAFQALRQRHRA